MPSLQPESNPFNYQCNEHPVEMLQAFQQLYFDSDLCDVVLQVGDSTFAAHRIVLAAGSPYFNAMFRNPHIESTQDTIILNGIDPESLTSLLDFIYSSSLAITENNVQNLLAAASLLQILPVKEACCQFLLVRLEPDNCLGICSFADAHGCETLKDVSWQYAMDHFNDVSRTEEFLSTPWTLLESLFRSENLRVQSEEEVLDALMLWYQHDSPARHESFVNLLQYTKLPLIPYTVLKQKLLHTSMVAEDTRCQQLLSTAKIFQSKNLEQQQPQATGDFNPYSARKSMSQRQLIYIVGGETYPGRSTVATVEEYNPAKDSWRQLAPMPCARRGMGVCVLNGLLYAIGGSDGLQALCMVECYDPNTNVWTKKAGLNENRSSVAAAVVNDVAYAIGGYDGVMNCLSTVEKYDPETDTWSYVKEMNTPRSMVSVGVINSCIFVIGGYDGGSDLSSCEVYNTEDNTWRMIEPMHSNRCMAGVGVVDNLLYAVGGCDCAKSLSTVEFYDTDKNTWTVVSEMTEARSGLGVAVVGRVLYAVGGYTGTSYCNSVEKFDPMNGQWIKVLEMSSGRRRFGCCT